MHGRLHRWPLLVAFALTGACGSDPVCDADDDCSEQTRCYDGACAVVVHAQPPAPQDPVGDPAAQAPASSDPADPPDPPAAPAAEAGACALVGGVLAAEDLPTPLGRSSSWIEAGGAGPIAIDLDGELAEDGVRVWDLSGELVGDVAVELALAPATDAWFAGSFQGASWTSPLAPESRLVGVYRRAADAVLLLGYASEEPGVTLVTYDPPVRVTALPLMEGVADVQTTVGAGTFNSIPWFGSEDRWETLVDGRGRLRTPAGTFDVLRLRTIVTSNVPVAVPPYLLVTTSTRYTFLAPCLGVVGVVIGQADEPSVDFEEARYVQRLGVMP